MSKKYDNYSKLNGVPVTKLLHKKKKKKKKYTNP